jgi:hypothetical protein
MTGNPSRKSALPWRGIALALLGVGLLSGCGSGPPAASISGEVTVDGVRVTKGIISFAPADKTGVPATAEIKDGQYTVRTTAGNKFVQISVPIVTGTRKESSAPNAPTVELTAESLPVKYNARTELTFDAQPGSNARDWPLNVKRK